MKERQATSILSTGLLFLFIALSCTETEVVEKDLRPSAGQEVDASFNLQVLASQPAKTRSITFKSDGTIDADTLSVGINDSIRTKATASLSEVEENKLSDLWVGQYDATTGARLFSQYFSSLSGNTIDLKLIVNSSGQTSRVYFVANAGDLGAVDDTTMLKTRTLPYGSIDLGLPDNNLCMMMGQWQGEVPSDGVHSIAVQLRRLLAKISFTYAIGGSGFSFTPTSVTLMNAPTQSQVAAPTTQLTGMSYKDYTDTKPDPEVKTYYWYLPENMAGTVSDPVVTSEKQKTGKGVTNATCIELRGDAVQEGVLYNDVLIRFYPGTGENSVNNYDIVRNAYYRMSITLMGLDVSDKRITVGEVPPFLVDPDKMPAEKGSEKAVQIPARPGIPWKLKLPIWLSTLMEGSTTATSAGATIEYDGPLVMTLQAVEANPKVEDRSETIQLSIDNIPRNFQIIQAGSNLTLNNNIVLDAAGRTEGSATFTATKGLPWQATPNDNWIVLVPDASTESEATGELQTLKVKPTSANPFATSRKDKIVLKAGASIAGDYTALRKEIVVVQDASRVTDCTSFNKTVAEGGNLSGVFTATAGLDWRLSVGDDTWIQVTNGSSGTPTTGSPQPVSLRVNVNPNSTPRNGGITVQAGDLTNGPKGYIAVNQLGSTFNLLSSPTVELNWNKQNFNITIQGTKGLRWEVKPQDAAKPIAPTQHTGNVTGENQNIAFVAQENIGPPRTEMFYITAPGGDHTRTVTVRQKANPILTINQEILANYVTYSKKYGNLNVYPPFDIDGDGGQWIKNKHNVIINLTGTPSMTGKYQLQVESTQNDAALKYDTNDAKNYCDTLTVDGYQDWRLPTMIELYAMWDKAKGTYPPGDATDDEPDSKIYGAPFTTPDYWSCSVYNGNNAHRCLLYFASGGFSFNPTYKYNYSVRCVRDTN